MGLWLNGGCLQGNNQRFGSRCMAEVGLVHDKYQYIDPGKVSSHAVAALAYPLTG